MIATTFRIPIYSHDNDRIVLERSLNLYEVPQVNEVVHLGHQETCVLRREFVIGNEGMTCEVFLRPIGFPVSVFESVKEAAQNEGWTLVRSEKWRAESECEKEKNNS